MGPTGKEWGCTTSGCCTRGTAPDVGGPTTPQVGIQRAAEPADNFRRPSQFVLDEARAGDAEAAAARLAALDDTPLLTVTAAAVELAAILVAGGGLPAKAKVDALHVAMAAAHGLDYLLTWNCTHIANATLRGRIEDLCRSSGMEPPIICTPLELQGKPQ
jgi:hypothetical protein